MSQKNLIWELGCYSRSKMHLDNFAQVVISIIFLDELKRKNGLNYNNLNDDEELISYAESSLRDIDEKYLKIFKEKLTGLSKDQIQDLLYNLVFNNTEINRFDSTDQICNLIFKLMDVKNNEKIYDFGSGIGNFLLCSYLNNKNNELKNIELIGSEINFNQYIFSKMVMAILDIKTSIQNGDYLLEENPEFNKAFVFPPINIRNNTNNRDNDSNIGWGLLNHRSSYEWTYIDKLVRNLKDGDKVIALVSPKLLFHDADYEYRQELINKGLIEAIIQLPSGSLSFTSIKMNVLIFSKNNEKVKIINSEDLMDASLNKTDKVDSAIEEIINVYNSDSVCLRTNEELSAARDIQVEKLLLGKPVINDPVILSKVAEVFSGTQYSAKNFNYKLSNEKSKYKILTSTDIQDGIIFWNSLHYIDYNDTKFDKYAVQKNDVIITSKSSKVKIAVIDVEPEEKVIVTGGMIIIRPNIKKLNPFFLKIFLESNSGRQSLTLIQKGMSIISLNPKYVALLQISCPNIEKQNQIANKFKSKLTSLLGLKKEMMKLEDIVNTYYDLEMESN